MYMNILIYICIYFVQVADIGNVEFQLMSIEKLLEGGPGKRTGALPDSYA